MAEQLALVKMLTAFEKLQLWRPFHPKYLHTALFRLLFEILPPKTSGYETTKI